MSKQVTEGTPAFPAPSPLLQYSPLTHRQQRKQWQLIIIWVPHAPPPFLLFTSHAPKNHQDVSPSSPPPISEPALFEETNHSAMRIIITWDWERYEREPSLQLSCLKCICPVWKEVKICTDFNTNLWVCCKANIVTLGLLVGWLFGRCTPCDLCATCVKAQTRR